MRLALARLWTLAAMTCGESLRQPVCLLLLIAAVVMTILAPLLLVHPLGDARRLARDSALAVHFVAGLVLAIHLAIHVFATERRNGTTGVLVTKPVSRGCVFLARLAGVWLAILLFSANLTVCTLAAERIATRFECDGNRIGWVCDTRTGLLLLMTPALGCAVGYLRYRRHGRSFSAAAIRGISVSLGLAAVAACAFDRTGAWAPFAPRADLALLPASLLVTVALCALAALAMACGVRLRPPAAITGMTVLLFAGLLAGDRLTAAANGHAWAGLALLLPNWQHFWIADRLTPDTPLPPGYVAAALLYGLALAGAAAVIGIRLFERADID